MKNAKDSLGDRMKGYENVQRLYLTKRMPTIIRLDGKAFHSFTRGFQRPFDMVLMNSMWDTAKYLCANIMGCKVAYTQSDEITLLLTDYEDISTQAWFDKNIVKMISISASMATLAFNNAFRENAEKYRLEKTREYSKQHENDEILAQFRADKANRLELLPSIYQNFWEAYPEAKVYENRRNTALFDSRVFNLPKEEVCNCFIWRQQDATRNAIQMLGQSQFSHKQLQNKNCNEIQEMLWQEKNINFNDLEVYKKRGACIVRETYDKEGTIRSRWQPDLDIPIFTQDRDYIEKYL